LRNRGFIPVLINSKIFRILEGNINHTLIYNG
jgi:hypothetical protein